MPTEEKLKKSIEMAQNKLEMGERYKEFRPLLQRMMSLITDMEGKFMGAMNQLEKRVNTLADKLKNDTDTTLVDLKKKSDEGFQGEEFRMLKADIKKMEQRLNEKIASVRDGRDAKPSEVALKLKEDSSFLKSIKGDTPSELEIQNALQPFMEKTAKEQEEAIKKFQQRLAHSGRARRIPIIRAINLTSEVDGQRRIFTLPRDTTQVFFGLSSQFPFALHVDDLTLAGNEVTLHDTVPTIESGQTLVIIVEVLFNV